LVATFATSYRIEALSKRHDRAAFTCGSSALERYLQQQARQDVEKSVAAAFVLLAATEQKVLGYYTLSASLINTGELPEMLLKKLPRYPQLPVTLLGRLALDTSVKGQGLGQFLLLDALHRSWQAASTIAAMAVVVDAKDAAAEAFYRHFSFEPLQLQPRRLFLPMKTVAGLFSG
jgi:predicted GNAT family N-acyltransferase